MTIFGMIHTGGSLAYTKLALETFYYYTKLEPHDSFVLIDNDATFPDNSAPPIHGFTLHINPEPLGFSANMNQILRRGLSQKCTCVLLNNDLCFSANWYEPLVAQGGEDTITAPLSNQQLRYAMSVIVPETQHIAKTFVLNNPMRLEDYLGNEAAFAALAEAHRLQGAGGFTVITAPFFCARIPYPVLSTIGLFDEQYGRGGGEDYDYCIRAWLKGFSVKNVLQSLLLHFGGKSSFDNPAAQAEYQMQQQHFVTYFNQKWGERLASLLLSFRPDLDQILGSEKEAYLAAPPLDKIRSLLPARIPPLEIF